MSHLEEGTIHAWLDGALGEAESRDVERHVAECADCSAAVAEARGLIAASSRILSALDDERTVSEVGAGGPPRREVATPIEADAEPIAAIQVIPLQPGVAPSRRRIPAWWTRVAAVLVVAAGTATVLRSGRRAESPRADLTAAPAVATATPEASSPQSAQSAAGARTAAPPAAPSASPPGAAANRTREFAKREEFAAKSANEAAPRPTPAPVRAPLASSATEPAAGERAVAARSSSAAGAAAPARDLRALPRREAVDSVATLADRGELRRADSARATQSLTVQPAASPPARPATTADSIFRARLAKAAPNLEAVVATGSASSPTQKSASAPSLAGCWRAQRSRDGARMMPAELPERFALDTARISFSPLRHRVRVLEGSSNTSDAWWVDAPNGTLVHWPIASDVAIELTLARRGSAILATVERIGPNSRARGVDVLLDQERCAAP